MKREEKNALSRQRILDAALKEFSDKGYDGASLNTVCAENGISKGIVYHYFKDKDELYLVCVRHCFEALTAHMTGCRDSFHGALENKLQAYFDARMNFFLENPLLLGIFVGAAFSPPGSLLADIAACREAFDEFNISVLTEFLKGERLRGGLEAALIAEDFRLYIDYFHMRFANDFGKTAPSTAALAEYEERCRRQLNMLLYGVLSK